ncbi:MAG: sugar phosphate isomerase/epimerase [Pyrinomonadaceae bacterium]|nr:sugar phosphate isomerase/epimerase [Acidobacteriota bacterium]MBP7377058.1 sugar phosphate isomerase/epimerase [Pyrinomonadaceae bacterium]
MEIALNGATTMTADLETDIRAAAAAGYDLVELRSNKLYDYLDAKTVDDLKALLTETGIGVLSINTLEHITWRSEEDYADIKAECAKLCEISAAIGCPYVLSVPGSLRQGPKTDEETIAESVRVLNELADIAEPYGIKIGFEFLGEAGNSVQTLDLGSKIVNLVGRDSVGNVMDTYHFYAGSSSYEAIDSLDPKKLFIFHINDAEDLPKSELNDSKRLYPGLGILPIKEIKSHLDGIGYDGPVSVEIFRPEYWEQDPFEVAVKARAATEEVLGLGKYAAGGSW